MAKAMNETASAKAAIPSHINAIAVAIAKHEKAGVTLAVRIQAQIESAHGEAMPTHAVYEADLKALNTWAAEKGLANGAHYARLYREAFVSVYGALPVVLTGEAARKRTERMSASGSVVTAAHDKALRDAKAAGKSDHWAEALAAHAAGAAAKQVKAPKPRADATVGAPAKSQSETVEQYVTRVGMEAVFLACANILAASKSDVTKAKTLRALAAQLTTAK